MKTVNSLLNICASFKFHDLLNCFSEVQFTLVLSHAASSKKNQYHTFQLSMMKLKENGQLLHKFAKNDAFPYKPQLQQV